MSQPESANLTSEKTKDIRMTNIIAAKGKNAHLSWNVPSDPFLCSCVRCCAHFAWTPRNGQNGK